MIWLKSMFLLPCLKLTNIICIYQKFSYENTFEICYSDFRNDGIKQIRTYL